MEELENLLTKYPTKGYQPGEVIIHQGDLPVSAHIIKSGVVKIYDIDKHAEIRTISFEGKYQFFPLPWLFSYKERAMFYYEAYTPCEVCLIPKEDFFRELSSDSTLNMKMLNLMVSEQIDSWRRIDGLTQLKAEDKLLYTIDYLSRRFGNRKENKVKILLPISQQELANYCGLTRETVSSALSSLKSKGVISSKGLDGFEVDIDKVEEEME